VYDPTIGRWTSTDPLGFEAGDVNLYRYVHNGPTAATDPSGLGPIYATLPPVTAPGSSTVVNPGHGEPISKATLINLANDVLALGGFVDGFLNSLTGDPAGLLTPISQLPQDLGFGLLKDQAAPSDPLAPAPQVCSPFGPSGTAQPWQAPPFLTGPSRFSVTRPPADVEGFRLALDNQLLQISLMLGRRVTSFDEGMRLRAAIA
jgi:hypothetical protein